MQLEQDAHALLGQLDQHAKTVTDDGVLESLESAHQRVDHLREVRRQLLQLATPLEGQSGTPADYRRLADFLLAEFSNLEAASTLLASGDSLSHQALVASYLGAKSNPRQLLSVAQQLVRLSDGVDARVARGYRTAALECLQTFARTAMDAPESMRRDASQLYAQLSQQLASTTPGGIR